MKSWYIFTIISILFRYFFNSPTSHSQIQIILTLEMSSDRKHCFPQSIVDVIIKVMGIISSILWWNHCCRPFGRLTIIGLFPQIVDMMLDNILPRKIESAGILLNLIENQNWKLDLSEASIILSLDCIGLLWAFIECQSLASLIKEFVSVIPTTTI